MRGSSLFNSYYNYDWIIPLTLDPSFIVLSINYHNDLYFVGGLGDLGKSPGRVIPKTQKMALDATLLNTQHYKVRSRVKWSNPGKGGAPFPTPWCSSYRKGSGTI